MRAVARHGVALCLLSLPAMAQERPPGLPTRDVDVTYRTVAEGRTIMEQRSRWSAGSQKLRLDPPTPGVWMVLDFRSQRVTMISDAEHSATDLPAPAGMAPGLPAGQAATRRGTDVVAGLPCTEWETADTEGQATLACYTADGVLLRARRGAVVLAQASSVSFAPLDPGVFQPPAGYTRRTPTPQTAVPSR